METKLIIWGYTKKFKMNNRLLASSIILGFFITILIVAFVSLNQGYMFFGGHTVIEKPGVPEKFTTSTAAPSNIQMNLGSGSLTAATVNTTTLNATGGETTVKNIQVNEDITVGGKIQIGSYTSDSAGFALTDWANKHGHTDLPNGRRMAYGTIGPNTYDSDSAQTISFSTTFSKIPVISITRHGKDLKSALGISNKTTTGFSVNRDGDSNESSLDYIAIGLA